MSGLAVGALALAGCWPVPGADANRSSHNPFEETLTTETVDGLTEQWRHPALPGANPVVSNGRVHIASGCEITTLNAATGTRLWWNLTSPVSVCNSGFPLHSSDPYVFDGPSGQRVQASSGASSNRRPGAFDAFFSTRDFDVASGDGPPSVDGFLVARRGDRYVTSHVFNSAPIQATYVARVGGRSITLEVSGGGFPPLPQTGFTLGVDTLFQAKGPLVRGYAVVGEAPPGCGNVTCPVWATPTDGVATRPVLSPDGATLYTRTDAGTLYAVDAATGAVRWTATGLGSGGAPALARGKLLVPTGTGKVLLFEAGGCGAATCAPDSPDGFDTGSGAPVTAVSVAGDVIYAVSAGSVYASGACFSGEYCQVAWSAAGGGTPVVSGGQLYVNNGSAVIAYGLD